MTFAYNAKPRCSFTGSVPEVDGTPSVHFSTNTGGIVDRGHRRFHVQARLGGRHGDAGDPDDDGREQDDGHGEDQDRADDLGHSRLIFAQDHFHAVASRWAPDNELAPEPTIYKVFAVVTIP